MTAALTAVCTLDEQPRPWVLKSLYRVEVVDMPHTRARRYSIEIKDAEGSVVFCAVAYWDDKDKRIAIGRITRLAQLPEVNFYAKPALEPQSDNSERRPRNLPVLTKGR
jgi:hypothetical protein